MKTHFTRLTALLCAAAILLCSLPMQALAADFQLQTTYEDSLLDELPVQDEPAVPEEPEPSEEPERPEQPEADADASAEPEAAPEEPAVSVLSTGNKSGDFTYSVLSDNTAQITGYSGAAANLVVPDKLDGYTVAEIENFCFSGNKNLVSLKLPDTVTRIGYRAFADCTNLASINYPFNLESVGDYRGGFLFDGTKIGSITVPEGITELNCAKKYCRRRMAHRSSGRKHCGRLMLWNVTSRPSCCSQRFSRLSLRRHLSRSARQ